MATRRDSVRPTLASVAELAGVSRATASRALAHDAHPDIGPETRDRVRAAATELAYRPSAAAQALRTGRSNSICLLVTAEDWIWWGVITVGVVAEARKRGLTVRMESWAPAEDSIDDVRRRLEAHRDDGLIVVSMGIVPSDTPTLAELGVPIVFIDDVNELDGSITLSSANYDGAYLATTHLIEQGRTKIAAIFRDGPHLYVQERRAGYLAALRDRGLATSDDLIAYTDEPYENPLDQSLAMTSLLDRHPDLDAVFASADYLAATALKSLRTNGIRVPEEVAVVGFDDERVARLTNPPLTTIRQPFEELGAEAVRLIDQAVADPTKILTPGRRELAVELIVRGSSVSTT